MVLAVVAVVFACLFVAAVFRPGTCLSAIIVGYGFEQWAVANSVFFAQRGQLINYLMGGVVLVAFVASIAKHGNPLSINTSVFWGFILLYLYAGLACLWAPKVMETSLFVYQYYMPYTVCFGLLAPLCIRTKDDFKSAMISTLIFGAITMVLLLVGTRIHGWGRTIVVAEGALQNRVGESTQRLGPLAIAEMSASVALIALLVNFRGVTKLFSLLRWPIILLGFALIIRSGSRGQLLACVAAAAAFVGLARGYKKEFQVFIGAAFLLILVGVTIFMFASFSTDSADRWTASGMAESFEGTRGYFCATLLSAWVNEGPMAWLIGLGSSASFDIIQIYPHVVVVEVLAEMGIIGLVSYLSWVVLVALAFFRSAKVATESAEDRGLAAVMGALLLFSFMLTFKQGAFQMQTSFFMFCQVAARLSVIFVRDKQKEEQMRWYHRSVQGMQLPTAYGWLPVQETR